MNKAIMAVLAVFILGIVATGVSATLTDTIKYKTTGLNTEIVQEPETYLSDGILLQNGGFLAFVPLDEWHFVDHQYVRDSLGTYTRFGYGFFNEYSSRDHYLAIKNNLPGQYLWGSSVTNINFVQPENTAPSNSCSN